MLKRITQKIERMVLMMREAKTEIEDYLIKGQNLNE